MQIKGFGPGALVDDIAATSQWYQRHLGLKVTIELDWFVSFNLGPEQFELSFVRRGHESVPDGFRTQDPAGLMFGFMVGDAAAEQARLKEEGVKIVQELKDEDYGQRHFYALDCNGMLLDIIELIPPSPEWLAANGFA
ncbi:VOC family protein [Amycolatopsis sp. NPDC059657]|uniref:VOC family protein n=1 Tax=Amycolatopsis sp. NPDC059657 TaxID=3346899 RepID=UPI00366FAD14